jgi:hypothetical protein
MNTEGAHLAKPGTLLASLSILSVVGVGLAYPAFAQDQRKDATEATKAANDRLLKELPFSDSSDFDNAKRGLIAPLPSVPGEQVARPRPVLAYEPPIAEASDGVRFPPVSGRRHAGGSVPQASVR